MRALALVATLLSAATAAATPNFPGEIATHLSAPTPQCTICHQGTPALGTATTPFAVAMKARGLVAYDLASLDAALDALAAEGQDSNHNGISDIEELKAGNDPNAAAGSTVTPTYGCFGSVARARSGAGGAASLALLLLVLVARRPRRGA